MLLDTDFFIWCIRKHSKALDWLNEFDSIERSVITCMELVQGTKKELADLHSTLKAWEAEILHLNEAISVHAAELVKNGYLCSRILHQLILHSQSVKSEDVEVDFKKSLKTGHISFYSAQLTLCFGPTHHKTGGK